MSKQRNVSIHRLHSRKTIRKSKSKDTLRHSTGFISRTRNSLLLNKDVVARCQAYMADIYAIKHSDVVDDKEAAALDRFNRLIEESGNSIENYAFYLSDFTNGKSLLLMALEWGWGDLATRIMIEIPDQINLGDVANNFPIPLLIQHHNRDLLRLALRYQDSVQTLINMDINPLTLAVETGWVEGAKILSKACPDLLTYNDPGAGLRPPVIRLIELEAYNMLPALLALGPQPLEEATECARQQKLRLAQEEKTYSETLYKILEQLVFYSYFDAISPKPSDFMNVFRYYQLQSPEERMQIAKSLLLRGEVYVEDELLVNMTMISTFVHYFQGYFNDDRNLAIIAEIHTRSATENEIHLTQITKLGCDTMVENFDTLPAKGYDLIDRQERVGRIHGFLHIHWTLIESAKIGKLSRREIVTKEPIPYYSRDRMGEEDVILPETVIQDVRDEAGNTPLHYAALSGDYWLVKSLIRAGFNIFAINQAEFTPIAALEHSPYMQQAPQQFCADLLNFAQGIAQAATVRDIRPLIMQHILNELIIQYEDLEQDITTGDITTNPFEILPVIPHDTYIRFMATLYQLDCNDVLEQLAEMDSTERVKQAIDFTTFICDRIRESALFTCMAFNREKPYDPTEVSAIRHRFFNSAATDKDVQSGYATHLISLDSTKITDLHAFHKTVAAIINAPEEEEIAPQQEDKSTPRITQSKSISLPRSSWEMNSAILRRVTISDSNRSRGQSDAPTPTFTMQVEVEASSSSSPIIGHPIRRRQAMSSILRRPTRRQNTHASAPTAEIPTEITATNIGTGEHEATQTYFDIPTPAETTADDANPTPQPITRRALNSDAISLGTFGSAEHFRRAAAAQKQAEGEGRS